MGKRAAKKQISGIDEVDGIYIIRIGGDFDVHSTPTMCRAIDKSASKKSPDAVLLDFAGIDNVDSAAFACLISLIKGSIKDPGRIGVFNLSDSQRSLIEILRVHEIINNFTSEKEALAHYGKSRA